MLHVLWVIVKIIGIVAAVLIGLVLLTACLIAFAPFRYKADVSGNGSLDSVDATIRFSWMFHLLSGMVTYREKHFEWKLRIGWKVLPATEKKQEQNATKRPSEDAQKETPNTPVKERPMSEPSNVRKKPAVEKTQPHAKETQQKQNRKSDSKPKKIGFFQKIKCTFQRSCATIKVICEKKDRLKAFLQQEEHRKAFAKLWQEIKRLLRFLKPKVCKGRVQYGTDDPALTGQILAVLSVCYPLYGEAIQIQPNFEEALLEGELHVEGSLRIVFGMIVALQLIANANVRRTIQDIKQFQL